MGALSRLTNPSVEVSSAGNELPPSTQSERYACVSCAKALLSVDVKAGYVFVSFTHAGLSKLMPSHSTASSPTMALKRSGRAAMRRRTCAPIWSGVFSWSAAAAAVSTASGGDAIVP